MPKIRAIIAKEWHEATRNRMVMATGIFLPLVFVILPLVMLAITSRLPVGDAGLGDAPPGVTNDPELANLTDQEKLQAFLAGQMLTLFLLVPLAIPMTIATYSIVGEKRERSLEPLLATPITVTELLIGKAVAAALPGVAVAWLGYALFLIGARFFVVSEAVYATLLNPTRLVAIIVVAPLLTVLAVTLGLMVSSRVNDPRAAEQLGMLIILPIIGLFVGQMAGLLFIGVGLLLVMAALVLLLDGVLIYFAARLFQRESILTRWK